MKNAIIFSLSFFVCLSCFAQDRTEKQYFKSHPELGGDVVIKSSSFTAEKDGIYKTFEVECVSGGVYYLDAWIMALFSKDGYPEYKIAINGVLSGFTLKPQTDGWHGLALTDANKLAAAVKLKPGMNTIAVIGKGPEVPGVEFIKLSSSLSRAGILETNYKRFVESVRSNTLNNSINSSSMQVGFVSGTAKEIYDWSINIPFNYTYYWSFSLSPGMQINISAGSASFPCVIELFNINNPDSYSWTASSPIGPNHLNVTIPANGWYTLLLRCPNPLKTGVTSNSFCVDGTCYSSNNCIVTYSPQFAVTPGYPTPANFFVCKVKNNGAPWLFIGDKSGRIRAYNRNFGSTSDGYWWEDSPRIITNLTDISYGMVFDRFVYESDFNYQCDLYMGLTSPINPYISDTYKNLFPHLVADNSFLSGTVTSKLGAYNCFAWSVGDTTQVFSNQFYFSIMKDWDDWYNFYGYTRVGANADNAAIALWGFVINDTVTYITHASVRKNSTKPYPHGFEWESKLGGTMPRVMHTRDALANDTNMTNTFGHIIYYYRPIAGNVNFSSPVTSKILQSSFSASELNRIATLKNDIPATVQSDFDMKYLAWEKTWSRPEIAIHSNPFMYARSSEYKDLLAYCMKYGKAIWSLVFDKLAQGDIYVISLLRDLTYTGSGNFGAEITHSASVKIPTLYMMQVDYCKGLLAKEGDNMLKSIRAISAAEAETVDVDRITANSQEIQLSLFAGKAEKVVIAIHSVSGNLEYKAHYHLRKGSQTVKIHTSNLKKGIHIVQITVGGKTNSQTINL